MEDLNKKIIPPTPLRFANNQQHLQITSANRRCARASACRRSLQHFLLVCPSSAMSAGLVVVALLAVANMAPVASAQAMVIVDSSDHAAVEASAGWLVVADAGAVGGTLLSDSSTRKGELRVTLSATGLGTPGLPERKEKK